jgi:hypothetical protein
MRRTTSASAFSHSQSLPAKQKGFKPPLAVSKSLSTPIPSPTNRVSLSPIVKTESEADSSYEEMSFDMDALEETMQKYD